jgi:hypothetical protein
MSTNTRQEPSRKPYDVALSFADEDRDYVRQVAKHLEAAGVRVFYDEFEKVRLWGENLVDLLDSVYQQEARYVVVFVSKYYAEKAWTTFERRSAQSHAIHEAKSYLLPARFDSTDLPGLHPTTGYIDLSQLTPREFAELIRAKIGAIEVSEGGGEVFIRWNPDNPPLPSLITDVKPPGWEYMLTGALLLRGVHRLAPKRRSFELGFSNPSARLSSGQEAMSILEGEFSVVRRMIDPINRVLSDCLMPALGLPGESGNEEMIEECTSHLLSIYESFFDWAHRVRSYNVPTYLVDAVEAAARMVGGAIKSFEEFVTDVADLVSRLPTLIEDSKANGPMQLEVAWIVRVDDSAVEDFNRAVENARRHL